MDGLQKIKLSQAQQLLAKKAVTVEVSKLPKTLILVPDLKIPGGVTNYYKTLKLDAIDNVSYFAITKEKPQSTAAAIARLFVKYCQFFLMLIKDRYDVVVLNPSLDLGKSFHRELVFILITHLLGRKTVVFFRGWFDPYEEKIKKSRFKTFLFNISYARASRFIVLGNIFKTKLLGLGVPETTKFHVETTVADSRYVQDFDLTSKLKTYQTDLRFLFLSRIEKEKGIYIAIDAFRKFTEQHKERKVTLVIAGDGPDLEAVKEYVRTQQIDHIDFVGHVSEDTKKKVLLESHIMVFPSFTEGLPNVILEGMLYGMPIIARAAGGIPEVVEQNVNGLITDSFDADVFYRFITAIANDEMVYKNMAERNHHIAVQKFTSEKVKERMLNILRLANA